jgi:hypothetical protein
MRRLQEALLDYYQRTGGKRPSEIRINPKLFYEVLNEYRHVRVIEPKNIDVPDVPPPFTFMGIPMYPIPNLTDFELVP